jgi:hypothetical protein
MRTFLPLGLVLAGLGVLVGCSSDEDKCAPGDTSAACRGATNNGGSGGQTGGSQGGTTQTGSGGTTQTGQGGGSGGNTVMRGDVIEFVPDTPTATSLPFRISSPALQIEGSSFADRSMMGNTFTATAGPNGELCVAGSYEVVPNSTSYGTYWGVDFGFNLSLSTTPTAGDAGVDGGGGGELVPLPWHPPANVIGFSFVITGGTTGLIRFRARPAGLDPMAETSIFCKPIPAAMKDVPTDVLFADVHQQCWNSGTPAADVSVGFDRISWNLPADVMPTQIATVNFDFCIKDLKPILSAP